MLLSPPDDAEALRRELASRYELVLREIRVATTAFRLLKVRDTNALVDAIDPDEFARDERLPYWADVWASSVELARWCLEDRTVRGKRVLEIGCGLGLAGIAAAAAGGRVVLSDYEPDAVSFARYNASINLPAERAASLTRFLHLDWRHLPSLEPFDMIIGADVAYERSSFPALMEVLRTLLRPRGVAVFADPDRAMGAEFFRLAEENGFRTSGTRSRLVWEGRSVTVVRVEMTKSDGHA